MMLPLSLYWGREADEVKQGAYFGLTNESYDFQNYWASECCTTSTELFWLYLYVRCGPGVYPKKKLNSMVWVRERTIPTERPPLVGEVIANFCK
jgi:hypothetical protein